MTDLILRSEKAIVMPVGNQNHDIDILHLCKAHNIPYERNTCFEYLTRDAFNQRSQLILLGGPVETDLTQIALSAMIESFQVFILVDRVFSDTPPYKDSVMERLYQNGVSPVLWMQMLHEIKMQERM